MQDRADEIRYALDAGHEYLKGAGKSDRERLACSLRQAADRLD